MVLFSQRHKYTLEKSFQLESIDNETRVLIWNEIFRYKEERYDVFDKFATSLWTNYLRKPKDDIPHNPYSGLIDYRFLKEYILNEDWYKIYDIIEFATDFFYRFDISINKILERENCAYRLIDKQISEITNQEEIDEIKEAISSNNEIKKHLETALQYYSDRTTPDYRNSIKESISAVENICRTMTDASTLDRALKTFENKGLYLNLQLKAGLEKIYYYTNSKEGIRHALMEESTITKADAKFMLVICSAFINYLKDKAR